MRSFRHYFGTSSTCTLSRCLGRVMTIEVVTRVLRRSHRWSSRLIDSSQIGEEAFAYFHDTSHRTSDGRKNRENGCESPRGRTPRARAGVCYGRSSLRGTAQPGANNWTAIGWWEKSDFPPAACILSRSFEVSIESSSSHTAAEVDFAPKPARNTAAPITVSPRIIGYISGSMNPMCPQDFKQTVNIIEVVIQMRGDTDGISTNADKNSCFFECRRQRRRNTGRMTNADHMRAPLIGGED